MITLSQLKQELGIKPVDSGNDPWLQTIIRQVVARIRQETSRGIAWACDSVSIVSSKPRLRVIGHGWRTGQVVKVVGSGITALDAQHTITVIDQDTIQVDASASALEQVDFTVHPRVIRDIIPFRNDRIWVPEQGTPCLEISEVADNTGQNEWTALAADDWFAPKVKGEQVVEVLRKNGTFKVPIEIRRGQFGLRARGATETVRLTLFEGADIPPSEVTLAAISLCCDMYGRAGRGKDEGSFSFDDMSRTQLSGEERLTHVLSPTSVINSWVAR